MIEGIILALLGGIWRVIDGDDDRPDGWNWVLIVPAAIAIIMSVKGVYPFNGHYNVHWAVLLGAVIAMLDGYKDWNDLKKIVVHYAKWPAVAMVLGGEMSSLYIALLIGVGVFHWLVMKINPRWLPVENNKIAEFVVGACVLGGLAWA